MTPKCRRTPLIVSFLTAGTQTLYILTAFTENILYKVFKYTTSVEDTFAVMIFSRFAAFLMKDHFDSGKPAF